VKTFSTTLEQKLEFLTFGQNLLELEQNVLFRTHAKWVFWIFYAINHFSRTSMYWDAAIL